MGPYQEPAKRADRTLRTSEAVPEAYSQQDETRTETKGGLHTSQENQLGPQVFTQSIARCGHGGVGVYNTALTEC